MSADVLGALVLALVVIVVTARLLGVLAGRLGQPPVIGEILAGVLLGPTLFGGALPEVLFPAAVRPALQQLADIGVVVFMFLVGVELDRRLLRGRGRVTVSVAVGAIVVPFGLGVLIAPALLSDGDPVQQLAFRLFIGTAMSVTAFPVLARILADRGLLHTPVGGLALAAASLDDVMAWGLLAVVAALAGGTGEPWLVLLVVPFALVLLFVVRPVLARLCTHASSASGAGRWLSAAAVAVALPVGLWLSARATEAMGLHLIFGAFLFGVAMPRSGLDATRERVQRALNRVSSWVLLPVFFTVAGLQVDLSGLDAGAWGVLGLILLVAMGGKWLGVAAGAGLCGIPPGRSFVLATLLNTRGLTELIVLTTGLQLGVLDERSYSLLIVMALVTTMMTGVVLSLLDRAGRPVAEFDPPPLSGVLRST
ncbi:cation:proton antiporter [Pseudonocardia sp. ICBG1142]|uniref:cation:proton antiporter domain-containing protein n=1 Tax=Pseudonocardia sp. ICBG1142 TaxID=2846760 RepID=UPI001CF6C83A|nr:cation:proton antiporter [Pseudonocardia sp. ICBG1142]